VFQIVCVETTQANFIQIMISIMISFCHFDESW